MNSDNGITRRDGLRTLAALPLPSTRAMRGALTRAALADCAATQPDASPGSVAIARRLSRRVMPLSLFISLDLYPLLGLI